MVVRGGGKVPKGDWSPRDVMVNSNARWCMVEGSRQVCYRLLDGFYNPLEGFLVKRDYCRGY